MKKEMLTYSLAESKLMAVLSKGKPMTISQLCEKVYRGDMPNYPENTVRITLKRLGAKMQRNREKLTLWKEDRRGPHAINYWME